MCFLRLHYKLKQEIIMKKGLLFGLAAVAVGVVVYTLGGKKTKPSSATGRPITK
jgi:hypothetical protein